MNGRERKRKQYLKGEEREMRERDERERKIDGIKEKEELLLTIITIFNYNSMDCSGIGR